MKQNNTNTPNSTARLFWFISVPIVLAWVSFASLAVYQSVVHEQMITENQILVIGIVGGPALLIITNILDLFKQETTTDIDNMTPSYAIQGELSKINLSHELERKAKQHDHEMFMERTRVSEDQFIGIEEPKPE
tara:strand:- start:114 stop:515 length:402 start_codon:yes stop_codon:yes gene_type:complete